MPIISYMSDTPFMPDLLFLAIHSIYATNTISGIDTPSLPRIHLYRDSHVFHDRSAYHDCHAYHAYHGCHEYRDWQL